MPPSHPGGKNGCHTPTQFLGLGFGVRVLGLGFRIKGLGCSAWWSRLELHLQHLEEALSYAATGSDVVVESTFNPRS